MDIERRRRRGKLASSSNRNPLQENVCRVQIPKPNGKLGSNRSASSSSSSCHFPLEALRKAKSEVKPKKPEAIEVKRKPFSQGGIRSLSEEKSLKSNGNFGGKSRKIPSRIPEKKLKKGFEDFGKNMKDRKIQGLFKQQAASAEKCTPMVKAVCVGHLDFERSVNSNGDSVKTPPVEASISPEIQFQSNCESLVLKSGAAPVVYGAGHLLSGVTDKRKCRRRGSLRGGVEKPVICNDIDGTSLFNDSIPDKSTVPLLGEASVRWLPSDCMVSPSSSCRDDSDMFQSEISFGSSVVHSEAEPLGETLERMSFSTSCSSSVGKDFGLSLHLPRVSDSCSSDGGVENMSLQISWQDSSVGRTALASELDNCFLLNEDEFGVEPEKTYLDSWESAPFLETMVQPRSSTPLQKNSVVSTICVELDSCCLSDEKISNNSCSCSFDERTAKEETYLPSWQFDASVDTTAQHQVRIPRQDKSFYRTSENAESDPHRLSNEEISEQSNVQVPLKVRESYLSSWECFTLESMEQFKLRISWQDNPIDRTCRTNIFFPCHLSNQGSIDQGSNESGFQAKEPDFQAEIDEDRDNCVRLDTDLSPVVLEYEPIIPSRTKEKLLTQTGSDECAESIILYAGSLAASNDSDWCHFYAH